MTQRTYDPIGTKYEHVPSEEPGKVAVAFFGNEAWLVRERPDTVRVRLAQLSEPKILVPIIAAFLILPYFLGALGTFLALILAAGLTVVILLNRQNPLVGMLLGPAPSYYLVNMSEQSIEDDIRIELSDTSIYANVTVRYQAQVQDATQVVKSGIKDVRNYLSARIGPRIRQHANTGKLTDRGVALRNALKSLTLDGVDTLPFKVMNLHCDVAFEGDVGGVFADLAKEELRTQAEQAAQRHRTLVREYYELLLSNPEKLRAEWLRPGSDREALREAFNMILAERREVAHEHRAMIKLGFDTGIITEANFEKRFPDLYAEFKESARGSVGRPTALTGAAPDQRQLANRKTSAAPESGAKADEPKKD